MFSSFNFEEVSKDVKPRTIGRKDRSVRYLRSLNSKRTIAQNKVRNRSVSINSKWATVREKSSQIISSEKMKKLDLNKGQIKPRNRGNNRSDTDKTSFSEIVKAAMINWASSMQPDQIETEPDRDLTTTNYIEETTVGDQRPILESQEIFHSHPTGFAIATQFFQDKYRKLIYMCFTKSSPFFYYWSALISIGVLYNMCAMVIFIFDDVHQGYFYLWMSLNVFFDICFVLDCVVGSRMSFVSEGNEVKQLSRTFKNYRESARFKWDIICLTPLDILLIVYSHISLIRLIRMIKAYRLYEFVELTERRTDFPHFMKIMFLTTFCAVLFHWNACVYFLFSLADGLTEDDTNAFGFSYYKVFDPRFPTCDAMDINTCQFPEDRDVLDLRDERPKYMEEMYKFWEKKHTLFSMGNFSREYSMTIYWSSLTITKCGQQPWPSKSSQNALEIFDTLIGVLVFATIIGSVGNVVAQMSQNVNDFRQMMDGIKFYMKYRGVKAAIQERVLNCFMYLNTHNQLYDEKEILSILPPRFQSNIASHLHSETLRGVALFSKCDSRFLQEVVMLVKQQVYSPNDYLCRKNEKAKEMFIVKKGTLSVIDDDTGAELDQLREGSTFGELSIVHVKGNLLGDRRSVSLRSLGYSDVYVLHQDDVTRLLQEYPEDRKRLLENARKMLHSRGLLETTELGEVPDGIDELEMDGTLDFLSVDEQLTRLESFISTVDSELSLMVSSFSHTSGFFKKRVTSLENIYNFNKKAIRSDMCNGILKTDYDKIREI